MHIFTLSSLQKSITIDEKKKSTLDQAEIKLSSEEDAPMCITLTADENDDDVEESDDQGKSSLGTSNPQSSSTEKLSESSSLFNSRQSQRTIIAAINSSVSPSGANKNLRKFEWTDSAKAKKEHENKNLQTIKQVNQVESVSIKDAEVYIRCISTSPNGSFVAVGSTDGQFSLHSLPTLERLWSKTVEDKNGIADVTFSADSALIAIVTSDSIQIFPTSSSTGNSSGPELYQSIRNPTLKGTNGCVFRAARFGRNAKGNSATKSSRLYTVVNSNPAAGLGSSKKDREKAKIRKCFISSWDTDTWTIVQSRQISDRPATVAEISDDGSFIAISTSDLSLHLLSSHTLKSIWQIRDTHAFPGTCLAFSRNGKLLASGSADMTLRIASIDKGSGLVNTTTFLESESDLQKLTNRLDADLQYYSFILGNIVIFILALALAILAWYFQTRFLT